MMQTAEDTSRSLNIRPFRGRRIPEYVYIYRKTSNPKSWSFKSRPSSSLVVGHADSAALYNATFHVNENGRQRVLRERRKNVHAGIIGTLAPDRDWIASVDDHLVIWYNPYMTDAFVTDIDGIRYPVMSASHVHLGTDGVVRAWGVQLR